MKYLRALVMAKNVHHSLDTVEVEVGCTPDFDVAVGRGDGNRTGRLDELDLRHGEGLAGRYVECRDAHLQIGLQRLHALLDALVQLRIALPAYLQEMRCRA